MISWKKHLDTAAPDPGLSHPLMDAYRSAIRAMAGAAARAAPDPGNGLRRKLTVLHDQLNPDGGLAGLEKIDRELVGELNQWGDRTADYFRQKTADVRELLILMNRFARDSSDRDDGLVNRFGGISGRLHAIADLEDISSIRQSLAQSALELKDCVNHLARDGKQTVDKLRTELSEYQVRLADAERLGSLDTLTNIDNRRGIERKVETRMAGRIPFCVALMDLNGFKQINDTLGHLAGDDLLRQFASEMVSRFGPSNPAGRWGGDEFLVICDGGMEIAETALHKASEWLFGDYRIKTAKGAVKVTVQAAAGLAQWDGKESMEQLLTRADRDMYEKKKGSYRWPDKR